MVNKKIGLFASVVLIAFLFGGCDWLDEDEDPSIALEKKKFEQAKIALKKKEDAERERILALRAISINEDELEERSVDVSKGSTIIALSSDGNNIIILQDNGLVWSYDIDDRTTKLMINLRYGSDGEKDFRTANFLYFHQNILTIGYFSNEIVSFNNKDNNTTTNSSSKYKYMYKERRYQYPSGVYLGEVDKPIKRDNLSKPGLLYQYRLIRNTIYREKLSGDSEGDRFGADAVGLFNVETGSKNIALTGLTVVDRFAWVASSENRRIFKIKTIIEDDVDRMLKKGKGNYE